MRYLITIEYFGKNYCGWQRQKNKPSVQQCIEVALAKLFGLEIILHGSGRTDSGVHALAQTAHFDAPQLIPERKLHLAINGLLPRDIIVKSAKAVADNFHSRFDVQEKTYIYKFYISALPSPTRAYTHAQLHPSVDIRKMSEACKLLIGTHDFAGFSATGSSVENTIRTVTKAGIEQIGDEVTFTISANGFLYKMVRLIVGTLIDIGKGRKDEQHITDLLQGRHTCRRSKTALPHALYLYSVKY